MTITILSLFPEMFSSVFSQATIRRAINKAKLTVNLVNIRDFATDKHKTVDDKPYGGGEGMILKIDVLVDALESVTKKDKANLKRQIVLLSPQGELFNDRQAGIFTKLDHLVLICGRYEGVDSRISHFVDQELSIGNYILSGGEIAAMVVVDATVRQITGVLSSRKSVTNETLHQGLLKYDQYTRPVNFRGLKVPSILLSGNHQEINRYRAQNAKAVTLKKRPDLLTKI